METDQEIVGSEAPKSVEIPMEDAPAQAEENQSTRKRPREQDDSEEPARDNDEAEHSGEDDAAADGGEDETKLSKNKLRKLKRRKVWEDQRQDRRVQRKARRHAKTAKNQLERDERATQLAQAEGIEKEEALKRVLELRKLESKKNKKTHVVPVAFIIDCDFEKYMFDNELVSLGGQITRSYSMNKQGDYQAHILISSWGGKLKERFETALSNTHKHWKGVSFVQGDFVEAGKVAWGTMKGPRGGTTCPALGGEEKREQQQQQPSDAAADKAVDPGQTDAPESSKGASAPEAEEPRADFTTDSVVYLSADSPNTLDKLEPYTSYVIGGLVDRNREKLLCQRRAEGKNIRTAKLPIGQYMQMASRQVLATNHVVEIMSKWLETGDWGKAFMEVIPKRKGGRLIGDDGEEVGEEVGQEVAGDGEAGAAGEDGNEDGEKQAEVTAEAKA